jgi:putative ABC transport system permease protein
MNAGLTLLLLRRFTLRHWRLEAKKTLMLIAILSLGVAVFVSIRLANRAAVASFTRFTDTLTGQSDWLIRAPAGNLSERVLSELREALGNRPIHLVPVLETTASTPARDGDDGRFGRPTYTLLGVDLLALANLTHEQDRAFFDQSGAGRGAAEDSSATDGGNGFWRSFSAGPQIWVSKKFAPTPPRQIELVIADTVLTLPVAGVIPTSPATPEAPANLMILDLPQLQKITGRTGRLSRVEFILEPGPRAEERRAELKTLLEKLGREGERWLVSAPGAERTTAETMTRAFRLNLTVLSLIALLVGMYLIFQALDGAVVRRRPEIAILRSLGVEESAIRRVWLWESAAVGLLGGALGLLLGWAGAQLSVRAVGRTVNALYYSTTVDSASLDGREILIGLMLGVGAALAAGWWPAREAARTLPAQILQRTAAPAAGSRWARSAGLGVALLALGWVCAQLPPLRFAGGGRFPLAGYFAALAWILGGGVLCAFLLRPLARAARSWGCASAAARVALSHVRTPSGRHRLAAAALLCAIGMSAGMAILVASFELTVRGWIGRTLAADLYVSSGGAQSAGAQNLIGAATAEKLATHPAVARTNRLLGFPIMLPTGDTFLSGTELGAADTRPEFSWVQAPVDDAIFQPKSAVPGEIPLALVSESFSERFQKKRGDIVRAPTPAGPRDLRIVGVFSDYGNERGSILTELAPVQAWFGVDDLNSVALFLKPGASADTVRAELLSEFPGLSIFTHAALRDEVLRIFRQTFSITYALEVIGVLVAVVGLALTLASVLLDRRDELTTLRALGFTHDEIARAAAIEGLAVAACATLGGLLLSGALGWLLIYVINKQSFGWTLGFALPWGQLAALAFAVIATGALVSYGVGRWGAELPADREE